MRASCCLLLFLFSSMSSAVRVLSRSELRCPRQDLNCTAAETNCLDPGGLQVSPYTPSGPESLQVNLDRRLDEAGQLQLVLRAQWTIRDDGSVGYLKATELHVLVLSTNQNLCVRYSFRNRLPMRSPSGQKWVFSADMLVLDPGLTYKVSVFNVPRPELDHTWYDVSRDVTAPDCDDPEVRLTQFCIQRGSLWHPNISLALQEGGSVLAVSFLSDPQCEKYLTIVSCSSVQKAVLVQQDGRSALNSTFSLDQWPRWCCSFTVEIKPFFPSCGEDCPRVSRTSDVCPVSADPPADAPDVLLFWLLVPALLVLTVSVAVAACFFCRKSGRSGVGPEEKPPLLSPSPPPQPKGPPTVLIIYSQDHRLYRDVVLKLCAFLQAKCGTKVLVDLLDATSIGVVGRVRWLERQRQRLQNPADKILVLCSRGVQAKWRAMCGHERVTLREDLLSPTDDTLTPFLNLFLPRMHQAGMLGKYVVAYFEDICSERDVPSVFDIAVRYSLMKHFEELYLRLVEVEKYRPGRVHRVPGIGADEYFLCPSGRALQLAIHAFRAYQLEHPDWFQEECVQSEEELAAGATPPGDRLRAPAVLERLPLVRDGPPAYRQQVEAGRAAQSLCLVAPEPNPPAPAGARVAAVLRPQRRRPPALLQVPTDALGGEPVRLTRPVLNGPGRLSDEVPGPNPVEQDEEEALLPGAGERTGTDRRFGPRDALYRPPEETEESQVLEEGRGLEEGRVLEEGRGLDQTVRGSCSGSDQGYSSRTWSQPDAPLKDDSLLALVQLQEELFLHTPRS